jgi:hypothetical protein
MKNTVCLSRRAALSQIETTQRGGVFEADLRAFGVKHLPAQTLHHDRSKVLSLTVTSRSL